MSEQNYLNLLKDVLETGVKKSIFGHDSKYIVSKFGTILRFNLDDGFPLLTTKKVFFKGAAEEIIWMLQASRDVVLLHNKGITIWDEWGAKQYYKDSGIKITPENLKELVKTWQSKVDNGEITKQIIPLHYSNSTAWDGILDQTKWIIDNIQKTPDRKSFLVSYWNPTQVYQMADQLGNESVTLPACHTHYSLNVNDGKMSLMLFMRSWDLFLGAPFNIAQYALLTHMYAKCTGFKPGELIITAADYHIYSDHVNQVQEQITRKPYPLPSLTIKDRNQKYLQDFEYDDFIINDYISYPTLKGEITVVGGY